MQRHRYKISFAATLSIYALLVLFAWYAFLKTAPIALQTHRGEIKLALSQFVPNVSPVETIVPPTKDNNTEKQEAKHSNAKENMPKPSVVDKKTTPEEPLHRKTSSVSETTPTSSVKPSQIPSEKSHTVSKISKKRAKHRKSTPTKHEKKRGHLVRKSRSSRGGGTPRQSAARKNRFLAALKAKIEHAKSYPRIAKRRGLQGAVKVRFTVLKNGRLGRIAFSGSPIFYRSARRAVEAAFPVDAQRAASFLPMEISLVLRYRLR